MFTAYMLSLLTLSLALPPAPKAAPPNHFDFAVEVGSENYLCGRGQAT